MIVGQYDRQRNEATLALILSHPDRPGSWEETFILDTGFTGNLLLTEAIRQEMGLLAEEVGEMELANGDIVPAVRCRVVVSWHGRPRTLFALVTAAPRPLVGMGMLRDSLVTLECVAGGTVAVEPA